MAEEKYLTEDAVEVKRKPVSAGLLFLIPVTIILGKIKDNTEEKKYG